MIFYVIQRSVRVIDFIDPSISSYEIKDNRVDMEPLNLGQHNFELIFGFLDAKTSIPIDLDPRIA